MNAEEIMHSDPMVALRLAPTEATRRWVALLQQIFEVDPLACPTCHGVMRLVTCITPPWRSTRS